MWWWELQPTAELLFTRHEDGHLDYEWRGGRVLFANAEILAEVGHKALKIGDRLQVGPFPLQVIGIGYAFDYGTGESTVVNRVGCYALERIDEEKTGGQG